MQQEPGLVPSALVLRLLPDELVAKIVLELNGGPINPFAKYESGFLFPGYRGGRELHYFEISKSAMLFMECTAKYLRRRWSLKHEVHALLFESNLPIEETWSPPYDDDWYHSWHYQDEDRIKYVPRHLYAGDPKPWIGLLCCGPQSHEEAAEEEAAEAAASEAAARKEKKRGVARLALGKWGDGARVLRARK